MGLNVEAWRLLSKYAFLFSKKEGKGGPYLSPSPRCSVVVLRSSLFQNNLHCLGERGAAEIGSYNKITKFLKNTS